MPGQIFRGGDAADRSSAFVTALVEVLLLLGRRDAAEDGVAMGKAAEPADDVAVMLGA